MTYEEKIRKQHGDRKAFEWFVRWKDEWYWKRTQELVASSSERMDTQLAELEKKMTALIGISTAISVALSITLHFNTKNAGEKNA